MLNKRLEQLLAIQKDEPDDAFTRYAIALEYKSSGNTTTAIEWLEKLRNSSPDYVPTYYMLAELYQQISNPAQAARTCDEGLIIAKNAGDHHAHSELMALKEEIEEG